MRSGSAPAGSRLAWPTAAAVAWLGLALWHIWPPAGVLAHGRPVFAYYLQAYRHFAYSDVVALYSARRFYSHAFPYFQGRLEYPVGIGLYTWVAAWAPGLAGYLWASAVGMAAALAAAVVTLGRARGAPAAWGLALSPLLLVFGLLNWDVLGLAALGAGLAAYSQNRPGWAGWWLGVGASTKLFPVVFLPYLAAELWRRRPRAALRHLAGFAAAAGVLNLPFALWARPGWEWFFVYNAHRAPDPGLWGYLVGHRLIPANAVDAATLAVTLAGGVVLLTAVLRGRRRAVAAGAAALIWWLLCNKTWSPQYWLWIAYAVLWAAPLSGWRLVFINAAGLADFGMAMRWLALGQAHSPALAGFVAGVVPLVLGARYLGMLLGLGSTLRPRPGSAAVTAGLPGG